MLYEVDARYCRFWWRKAFTSACLFKEEDRGERKAQRLGEAVYCHQSLYAAKKQHAVRRQTGALFIRLWSPHGGSVARPHTWHSFQKPTHQAVPIDALASGSYRRTPLALSSCRVKG